MADQNQETNSSTNQIVRQSANQIANQQGQTQQNATSQLNPAFGSSALLSGLLSQLGGINTSVTAPEQAAISSLQAQGAAGNQFAPQLTSLANSLLGGGQNYQPIVSDAYNQYLSSLTPTASGNYLDPNKNPFFSRTTQAITDQATKNLKDIYGSAGRAPGGAGDDFANALGRGVSTALAPVYANAYDTERGRQESAIRDLLSGGTGAASALSGLQQSTIGNQLQGANLTSTANQAQQYGPLLSLMASQYGRSIPLQTISQILGTAAPVAAQFGQQTGSQTGNTFLNGTQSSTGTQIGNTTGQQTTTTPFNPMQLLPLAASLFL